MNATGRYLGIDPGKNGAAAVVTHRRIELAVSWKPDSHGYKLSFDGQERYVQSLSQLASLFGYVERAAVEGLFAGKARQAIIGTAETAGELIAASLIAVGGDPTLLQRPMASRWRADLLRLPPGTKAAQADRYAKKVLQSYFGPHEALKIGHAVDAICIAMWCAGMRGNKV